MRKLLVAILILLLLIMLSFFAFYLKKYKGPLQSKQNSPSHTIKLVSDSKDYSIQTTNQKFLNSLVEQNHIWDLNKITWYNPHSKVMQKVSANNLTIHFTNDINSRKFNLGRFVINTGTDNVVYTVADLNYNVDIMDADLYIYVNTKYYDEIKKSINGPFSYFIMYDLAAITAASPMEVIGKETKPQYFEQLLTLRNNSFVNVQKK